MGHQLSDIGEEWLIKNGFEGATVDVMLYDDSTDTLSDTSDLADITTEPSDGNYARQSETISSSEVVDLSGDWGVDMDTVTFDMASTTGVVDSWLLIINFASTDAGDGGTATDHYILNGQLSQSYDLSNISGNLNVDAIGGSVT